MKHYVYFLKSIKNGKIYTGSTSKNPRIRLEEHNSGSNSFTRNNLPFKLVFYETYLCSDDAKNREKYYKTGFGRKIRDIIIKYIVMDS